MRELPTIKFGTGWVTLEIISEPTVLLTSRGYAPVVKARDTSTGLEYMVYISSRSFAERLEELRVPNQNKFAGLRIRVCKESSDPMSRYKVEAL